MLPAVRRGTAAVLLAFAGLACAQPQGDMVEAEPGRHALVIGNAVYSQLAQLPSAAEDARRMALTLKSAGFQVTEGTITTLADFEDTLLPAFRSKIRPGDLAVVYFSGHGFSYGPYNYIVPLATPLVVRESELSRVAISLETLEYALGRRDPALLVFLVDACRAIAGFVVSDPRIPGTVPKGPAEASPPGSGVNYMIGFATRPGTPALGFTATNVTSPFTSGLLAHLTREDRSFKMSFTDVITEVRVKTGNVQQPGLVDYSSTDFYLRPTPAVLGQERELWASTLETRDRERIYWFSMRYAASRYAHAAREWLRRNPAPAMALSSAVSPVAVERSWTTVAAVKLIEPPLPGFGFPALQSGHDPSADLPDDALGIPAAAAAMADDPDKLRRALLAFRAHGGAVTTAAYIGRATPAGDALGVREIPAGTRLQIVDEAAADREGHWLGVRTPGMAAGRVYLSAAAAALAPKPVRLGKPLLEVTAPPRSTGVTDLAEASVVAAAVIGLRSSNQRIAWVSLATADTADPKEAGSRAARLAHVRYLLRQHGIPSERITAVSQARDHQGAGVRLRFFGG